MDAVSAPDRQLIDMITARQQAWATLSSRVAAAETCAAELDGLRTLLDFGQIQVGDAARLYHGYISKTGFIPTR